MRTSALDNPILRYIIENQHQPGDPLPTIQNISDELGVSVAKTREALELARAMGALEIKPGRGTRVLDYSFGPVAVHSTLYAIGLDSQNFEHIRTTRNALEIQFWVQATTTLTDEDIDALRGYIDAAQRLLDRDLVQVPEKEHRAFHMTFFRKLDNPFVLGVFDAFWEAYEAFGLNLYRDLSYHRRVWDYHAQIVDAVVADDIPASRRLLSEHMNLLSDREQAQSGLPYPSNITPFE